MKAYVCILLLFFFAPVQVFSASMGDFVKFFPDNDDGPVIAFALEGDSQKNTFPEQRKRTMEADASGYERHFSKIRSSKTELSYTGIKAGAALNNLPFVYALAGYGKVDMEFSFEDELTDGGDNYITEMNFETDGFPVFGGGVAARLLKKRLFDETFVKLGLDARYRYFDFDESISAGSEETGFYEITYSSKIHEIQLSLEASIDELTWNPVSKITIHFTPYMGWKISDIIAHETFSDPGNLDSAGNPDPIHYSDDLEASNHISTIAGVAVNLTPAMSLGIETRFGDEDGYTLSFCYEF